ncbi:crustacean calcium-binding protein 23-like [Eriocheir sinensis]|uniref:crustacean calcium-binding protein 23-like n=1 Tax=Eriocheir sinensis TaxID=95602 RepID=UPI0021C56B39|nr:crustacean calcium-binding protein 23-like [Eriocheir sinensis]XP_050725284.1 crustacean calcium-binding protein 23-like [Eriocheir sinensis]
MPQEDKLKEASKAALEAATDPLEKLRSHCLSSGYSGILSLGRLFRRLDKDRSWTLSRDEMSRGVAQFGLDFSEADIDKLFKAFEKDGAAGINYEEFLEALRPAMTGPRKAAVEAAFKHLDKTGDGVVSVEDLKGVYSAKDHPKVVKGEATEEELLKKFLGLFESQGSVDGKVTKQEFFDYYSSFSKAIDDDEYFVSVVNKSWGL